MRELLAAGITFGVIAVAMMIMAGLVTQSYGTVLDIVGAANASLLNTTYSSSSTAITTFMSLLPVVGLALVGGLAIYYVLAYIGGRASR